MPESAIAGYGCASRDRAGGRTYPLSGFLGRMGSRSWSLLCFPVVSDTGLGLIGGGAACAIGKASAPRKTPFTTPTLKLQPRCRNVALGAILGISRSAMQRRVSAVIGRTEIPQRSCLPPQRCAIRSVRGADRAHLDSGPPRLRRGDPMKRREFIRLVGGAALGPERMMAYQETFVQRHQHRI